MKKILFLLLLALLFSVLSGCNSDVTPPEDTNAEETTVENENSIPSIEYDTESVIEVEPEIEFTVKGKKYDYQDNNVLLLNVKNTTKTNYSVSVSVDFCDSTGNTVKTETQTFEGYAAGYEKLFLFEPQITFDSYTYKVNVEEYTGECYAQYVDAWYGKTFEELMATEEGPFNNDFTKHPTLVAECHYKNASNVDLITRFKLILIDDTGEIFKILSSASKILVTSKSEGTKGLVIMQFLEGEAIQPEELKGDVSGICVIENLVSYEEE